MKPDQERVNNLLRDTVTLLCKNGLTYNDELRVEALIGVTVDSNDVFLVHINERFGPGGETKKISGSSSDVPAQEQRVNNGGGGLSISHNNSGASSRETPHQSPARPVQRTGSTDSGSVSSPGWGARGGVGSMPSTPQVDLSRVKLESVEAGEDGLDPEDCVMIMGRSPQAVARQAHMVAGQRRVLSHHASLHPSHHPHSQSSASQDDAQAMRRQYSQSLASSDGSFTDYDPDSSEPPIKVKKQAADGGEEDQGGGGGGGNTHTQNSTSTYFQQHHPPHTQHHPGGGPGSSQWPNLADIATQQAAHQAFQDDDSGGVGTLPGCSSWPLPAGSQRAMLQGTQGSDMVRVSFCFLFVLFFNQGMATMTS